MVLITGAGLTAPAAAAADECLVTPGIITDDNYFEPVITNVPLQVPVGIRLSGDWYHCDGMTADVQKADGTLATTLKLDQVGGTGHPPTTTWFAWLSAPVANGAGDWVITKLTHGANTLTTRVPFRLIRGSVLTIDPPPRTVGAARTPVTGLLRHYTSTGALAPDRECHGQGHARARHPVDRLRQDRLDRPIRRAGALHPHHHHVRDDPPL